MKTMFEQSSRSYYSMAKSTQSISTDGSNDHMYAHIKAFEQAALVQRASFKFPSCLWDHWYDPVDGTISESLLSRSKVI